jgi:hypothetical protein
VISLRKDEFMKQIEGCQLPESFDQHLLDHAAAMFQKWGLIAHTSWDESNTEYLFKNFGLDDKPDDTEAVKKEKKALRCLSTKIMKMQISRDDASNIMKNFNKIKEPGYRWLEK